MKWSLHLAHTYLQNDIVGVPNLSKSVIDRIDHVIQMLKKRNFRQWCKEELTPPSFRILDMISMYSIMLCAVSIKKQVTTASHTPACNKKYIHKVSIQCVLNYLMWLLLFVWEHVYRDKINRLKILEGDGVGNLFCRLSFPAAWKLHMHPST